MTREALRMGLVSEQTIRDALTNAKGDLFIASSYLGVTGRELDSYIRASETLQAFVAAINTVKLDPAYKRMSGEQFADELERLTRGFRLEALDVIHELATMSYETAAMAEVKLKAAIQLRGAHTDQTTDNGQNAVLMELNQIYQQAAPRIKSVRAVQIEYESTAPSNGASEALSQAPSTASPDRLW
jgi:hypothetical protein